MGGAGGEGVHNNVNVLNATELYLKMVEMVDFMYNLPQQKNTSTLPVSYIKSQLSFLF